MREKYIQFKIEMTAPIALRIARCLKRNEPKIYKVLVKEMKRALTIPSVSKSVCNCPSKLRFRADDGNIYCKICNEKIVE